MRLIAWTICMLLFFPDYGIIDRHMPYKRFNPIVKEITGIKASGYYPYSCKPHERRMEGAKVDKYGNKVRTMQCDSAYVTVAVDTDLIPLKTYFKIKEFPNKLFYACDVGGKIKGKKIDIAVWSKKHAEALPKYVTIQILYKKVNYDN